ncbi:glycerophosphodiester phosphodiesterase [Breznakiella homolactica]|uniref:GP-PDE domain-containing protein n=1 Tax=Breznakiella homolactica TaxID=2798577 RepID=A0A7T7XP59_9SPIR|nr:glycerophosphodiester phosphodiesterase family protein [Breznakiella homolactica]QQO09908.1 hypothetical protein JFL75_03075 [Breznakiella homolactica]
MAVQSAEKKPFALMAHRGWPWEWPENSLLSFRKALDIGADNLEFDVRLSRDGIPMIMHDATLERTAGSTGAVGDLTYDELKQARITFTKSGRPVPGEPVPSLEETFRLLLEYPEVVINCEIKDYSPECTEKCITLCRDMGLLPRTSFTCFDYGVLQRIKSIDPSINVQGFPLDMMTSVPPDISAGETLFDYIGVEYGKATKEAIQRYKELGLVTGVWVVNDTKEIDRCRELGVAILTTDRIDIFHNALKT